MLIKGVIMIDEKPPSEQEETITDNHTLTDGNNRQPDLVLFHLWEQGVRNMAYGSGVYPYLSKWYIKS
jgi:hypothetical protein